MVGAAVAAAAISAAAAIGTSVASSKAAGKAAKGQAASAREAAAADAAAAAAANAMAEKLYGQDQEQMKNSLSLAQGRLDPYANAGTNALSQLSGLMLSPHGAQSYRAESGTPDALRAQITEWQQKANGAYNDNQRFLKGARDRGDQSEVSRLEGQDATLRTNAEKSNQAASGMKTYVPGQQAMGESQTGGDLYRDFNLNDYLDDPTSGALRYDAADFRTGKATGWKGKKLTIAQIRNGLAKNPNATPEEVAAAMLKYGVTSADMAKATGRSVAQVEAGITRLRNPKGKTKAPDLTANFDQEAFLKAGGHNTGDLTRSFDQAGFLNAGGHNLGDLTKDFNKNAFLAQGGHTAADLTKDFNQNAFLAQGGHNAADLTKDFDRTQYLKDAGFNEADLARKFTNNDFQVDPGYAFRQQQGNQGIENAAASQGGQLSGATLKALAKYNSDLGSQEYGNAFNRFQSTQTQAGNALGNAQNAFNINRTDLNNELNSGFNRFNQNRTDLNNNVNNEFNRFNINRSDLNQNLNNAFNRFGQNRQDLNQNLNSAFDRFGQNRQNATAQYMDSYNRWNANRTNQFNRLASLAGNGQTAATNQAGYQMQNSALSSGANQNYMNTVSSNLTGAGQRQAGYIQGAGNAISAGQIAQGNAIGAGIAGVTNAVGSGIQMYQQQQNANAQRVSDDKNTAALIAALRR